MRHDGNEARRGTPHADARGTEPTDHVRTPSDTQDAQGEASKTRQPETLQPEQMPMSKKGTSRRQERDGTDRPNRSKQAKTTRPTASPGDTRDGANIPDNGTDNSERQPQQEQSGGGTRDEAIFDRRAVHICSPQTIRMRKHHATPRRRKTKTIEDRIII